MHDLNIIKAMNAAAVEEATDHARAQSLERHPAGKAKSAERAEAMQRHPAGKRLTEPAIDPATERATKPLKPAEAAHLASASAHELARKVLTGFTKNGEIPFALTGQAALDIIAVAIEADRAARS